MTLPIAAQLVDLSEALLSTITPDEGYDVKFNVQRVTAEPKDNDLDLNLEPMAPTVIDDSGRLDKHGNAYVQRRRQFYAWISIRESTKEGEPVDRRLDVAAEAVLKCLAAEATKDDGGWGGLTDAVHIIDPVYCYADNVFYAVVSWAIDFTTLKSDPTKQTSPS